MLRDRRKVELELREVRVGWAKRQERWKKKMKKMRKKRRKKPEKEKKKKEKGGFWVENRSVMS